MTQSPAKKSFFNRNVDLMNGPIFKSLFIFMLPILVSCLFQQLYNTVDTMIVGNVLGDTALAAIGTCGAIYELLVGFGIGIGNGLAIVAARAYGAGDDDQLKQTVAGSIVIGIIASAVITLAGAVGLHPLLELLDTPAEILEDAYGYIIIIDFGVIVMFAYNLCAGLLRAIGNSFMPLVFLIRSFRHLEAGKHLVVGFRVAVYIFYKSPLLLQGNSGDMAHQLFVKFITFLTDGEVSNHSGKSRSNSTVQSGNTTATGDGIATRHFIQKFLYCQIN
jgi:hypothetical protein